MKTYADECKFVWFIPVLVPDLALMKVVVALLYIQTVGSLCFCKHVAIL